MAYSPPNIFIDGQSLDAADLKGNDDALIAYLHEGAVAGDLKATSWVETRHVQAPILDPITGVQHGVTGFQGAQWDGGALVRCQFGSAFLTGKRYGTSTENFEVIPQTTFGLDLRRNATVVFHWWMESQNGPDNGPRSQGADAYLYVTEYNSSGLLAGTGSKPVTQSFVEEAINHHLGWEENPPAGPEYPFSILGYGNMSGVKVFNATDYLAVGLAHLSTIDRSAIINWGIALEVYYLK
jgi:hypothetical protein